MRIIKGHYTNKLSWPSFWVENGGFSKKRYTTLKMYKN